MKLLLLFVLMGCAASTYTIKQKNLLPYKESSQVTKVNLQSKSLSINSVADLRKKSEIGYAYTGVEYKKTPVFLETTPSQFVKDSLANALRLRNIPVVTNGEVILEVNILKFDVHEVIQKNEPEKARCELEMELSGQSDKTQWNGKFSTEFISPGDLSDGTERLGPTLASCMNEFVEKFISDEKFLTILSKEN